jgi:DNA (cytosine-5)-methyltransferase 1
VEPGKLGKPRLSARFAEWMMGLPDGWVTQVPGLTRGAQLKLIGNGVLPLQAAMAIQALYQPVE